MIIKITEGLEDVSPRFLREKLFPRTIRLGLYRL